MDEGPNWLGDVDGDGDTDGDRVGLGEGFVVGFLVGFGVTAAGMTKISARRDFSLERWDFGKPYPLTEIEALTPRATR